MLNKIVIEEKDHDLALKKLYAIAPLEELYYDEKEESEGKIFKSIKYKINVFKKEDIIQYIKNYILKIGELMGIELNAEVREQNGIINVGIFSNHSPILIGKEGKNIDALQLLLKQTITNHTGMKIKINVDASDYKLKKKKRLEREIKNIARDVLKSRIDVRLDPMNSYERRIVHSVISSYDNLETESVGETPNRYVTIKYKQD